MTTPQQTDPLFLFDVYGVTVGLGSSDPDVTSHLAEDFIHFKVDKLAAAPALTLDLQRSKPPYASVPDLPAKVYTPRNVSFHHGKQTYIDYSGRALGIFNSEKGTLKVFSEDPELLYETGYLFLLSQLGEMLDERRLHRIHALAVSVQNRAALVLLPMGGGKSTLAMHLLADPTVQFLSDDSPLVDKKGMLHAFPLRIGILPGSESLYAPEQLRKIQRMEFGPKLLLRHEFFEHRIVASSAPAFLMLGRRSLSAACVITPATRTAAFWALVPNCIVGLGLFQGMEFVFNRDSAHLWRKLGIAFSRMRNCIALVRRSASYTVVLGRDHVKNAETIRQFLEDHQGPARD